MSAAARVEQLLLRGVAVLEAHVARNAARLGQRLQPLQVRLALTPQQVRMRRAQHDVEKIGEPFDQRRQAFDDGFDALVRREQAKRQQHLAPGEIEPRLYRVRIDKRAIGRAMGRDDDLVRRHTVHRLERFRAKA